MTTDRAAVERGSAETNERSILIASTGSRIR